MTSADSEIINILPSFITFMLFIFYKENEEWIFQWDIWADDSGKCISTLATCTAYAWHHEWTCSELMNRRLLCVDQAVDWTGDSVIFPVVQAKSLELTVHRIIQWCTSSRRDPLCLSLPVEEVYLCTHKSMKTVCDLKTVMGLETAV